MGAIWPTSNRVVVCCSAGKSARPPRPRAGTRGQYGHTVVVLTIDPAKRWHKHGDQRSWQHTPQRVPGARVPTAAMILDMRRV